MTGDLPYLAFGAVSVLATGVLVAWLRRQDGGRPLGWFLVGAVGILLVWGHGASERAVERERDRLRAIVEGLGPTYALELGQRGHHRITVDTPPDDPLYLSLIEAEKAWLAVNSAVADIYTERRAADGSVSFVVDSETDYDRDGIYDGDREARTTIGEVRPAEDVEPELLQAFEGRASFSPNPVTDRWGTWVSAFVPLRGPDGTVDAVVGVDFPAEEWVRSGDAARRNVIAQLAVVELILLIAVTAIGVARRDLSTRRRNEAELRASWASAESASRLKGEFLATLSHEIRTPMNGVIGMTELLLETELTDEQQHYGRAVHQSAELLLEVINDILDFSKAEAGAIELDLVPTELRDLGESVLTLLAEPAHRRNVELVCSVADDVPADLLLDPLRVRQILTNLVGNAIKFTEAGEIVIRIDRDADPTRVLVSIRDTGIGISTEAQAHVFEPFRQADGTTARRFGGSGLGLAICRRLVERMGGRIGVESTPGVGSRFWFTLPLEVAPEGRAALPRILAGMSVLVVDDNPAARDAVARHVASWGARVRQATGGVEALQLLAETPTPPDLVLLDSGLAGVRGVTAARAIHDAPGNADVPVVMLAPLGAALRRAHEEGNTSCVVKPVQRAHLHDTLARLVG